VVLTLDWEAWSAILRPVGNAANVQSVFESLATAFHVDPDTVVCPRDLLFCLFVFVLCANDSGASSGVSGWPSG
jgi:hypothetical protein